MDPHNVKLANRDHSSQAEWRSWYRSPIWKTIKRHRLVEEPKCRKCASEGKAVPATHVTHIEHHQGDWALFTKYDNTQSLCHKHLVRRRHSGPGDLASANVVIR
jgi:5-methylcytosine-specific restriction enzyme A